MIARDFHTHIAPDLREYLNLDPYAEENLARPWWWFKHQCFALLDRSDSRFVRALAQELKV